MVIITTGRYINQDLVKNSEFCLEFEDGTKMSYKSTDVNSQLMETVHHENYHAYQDEATIGHIQHDDQYKLELWKANDENYTFEYTFYRIQSLEASAFDRGESKTQDAFKKIEEMYGKDSGYQEYLTSIQDKSYEKALSDAIGLTGNKNIQRSYENEMIAQYNNSHMIEIQNSYDGFQNLFEETSIGNNCGAIINMESKNVSCSNSENEMCEVDEM